MRTHKTVTIAREHFYGLYPCAEGLRAVLKLLPVKISTDPDENFELAWVLAHKQRARRGWWDAMWLANALIQQSQGMYALPGYIMPDDDYDKDGERGLHGRNASDVYLIMQYLAMAADILATSEGR